MTTTSQRCALIVAAISLVSVALYSQGSDRLHPGILQVHESILRGSVERKVVRVAPTLMTKDLDALASNFLSSSNAKLAELVIVADDIDIQTSVIGTLPTPEGEATFSDTLKQLAQYQESLLLRQPIARVLRVSGNAVLSLRKPNEDLTERIVSGNRDPSKFRAGGNDYQLLTFGFLGRPSNADLSIAAFLKSENTPSCGQCEALANELAGIASATGVEAHLRTDAWFPESRFPRIFRFLRNDSKGVFADRFGHFATPPLSIYERGPRMMCTLRNKPPKEFTCDGYGRYEHVSREIR